MPPDVVRQTRRWTRNVPLPDRLLDKVLYLEKLTVSFDGFKALDALTLDVEPGELRCIIGPNGAGKTTMMDVITGKTRPDHGSAWFGDEINLLALSEPEIAQAGIGRKFQKPTVFEKLTVFENLELSLWGDKSFWKNLVARLALDSAIRSTECWASSGSMPIASRWHEPCPMARSSGSRSACCSCRSRRCCWLTSRLPA